MKNVTRNFLAGRLVSSTLVLPGSNLIIASAAEKLNNVKSENTVVKNKMDFRIDVDISNTNPNAPWNHYGKLLWMKTPTIIAGVYSSQ
jgi:hypothetical protein